MSNNIKDKLLSWTDWSAKALILATAGLIWQMFQTQNEILMKLDRYDMRITRLESEFTILKGSIVTLEMLKRVELKLNLVLAQSGIKDKFQFTE